jgi:hypothetical protein
MNIVNAYVFSECNGNGRAYWVGECEALPIRTNVPELQGELVEFLGDTREAVIQQIICTLQARGISGRLRIK